MKAGKYYIGDPCYVISSRDWGAVLKRSDYFRADDGFFTYRGQECFAGPTRWGDGAYEDQHGNEYLVDSGTIAIMPVSCLTTNRDGVGGQILELDEDFEPESLNGMFKFGHVEIDTQ